MKISTVIPTYKRPFDLSECLDSILSQTIRPCEIIVVDNGCDQETRTLVKSQQEKFYKRDIVLQYIENSRDNSLTVAKNIGVTYSSGNLISFLDDDLVLDRRYYEKILDVFTSYPWAQGVTGRINAGHVHPVMNALGRLYIGTSFQEKEKMRVSPSLVSSAPSPSLNKPINTEWLSGASVYRAWILREIRSDENLKRYSWNEDQDLSYRVYKKYHDGLFVTPFARYYHKCSDTGRLPKKELIYMAEVYDLYLFYKLFDQSLKNKLIFLWSRIGRLLFKSLLVYKNRSNGIKELVLTVEAMRYAARNKKSIQTGDLNFFNRTLP